MNKALLLIIVLAVGIGIGWGFTQWKEKNPKLPEVEIPPEHPLIHLDYPKPGDLVTSPLTLRGEARGNWYFEASFPITLTNWDGLIIKQHYGMATEEWMTEEFVPFEATLEFENPYKPGDPEFMRRGNLILHKDNPSGLPEYDDAYEIQIFFGEQP